MTSNIGSQLIQEITQEGGTEEQIREAVHETLHTRFLPEFLNRIDEILIFHPLKREHIRQIVELQIQRLAKQLGEKGIALEVTAGGAGRDRRRGLRSDVCGARPLKRVIQQRIQNPLADGNAPRRLRRGEPGQDRLRGRRVYV